MTKTKTKNVEVKEELLEKETIVEEIKEEQNDCKDSQVVPLIEITEEDCGEKSKSKKEKKSEDKKQEDSIVKDLSELAMLLNTTVQNLKDEFYFLQIRKIMSKLQKVIVRYDMTDLELEKFFYQAGNYGLGGVTVAPVYLNSCIKQNKKNISGKLNISSIIDFPFGESSLKGKISDVKESVKLGANSVAVAVPSMKLNKDKLKELKKECRKFCANAKRNAGIVLNASDINEENYVEAMKVLRKVKLSYIVLAFGDATIDEVKHKLAVLNKLGINKKLFVLANVDRVESVVEIFKLNVDSILTPYADDIGIDLLKRFNLIAK